MQLTSDRLFVEGDERIRGVLIVEASQVAVLAAGGMGHLRHELEDVGFTEVRLFLEAPAPWTSHSDTPQPSDPEWLLWFEARAKRAASLARALTEDLRIAHAWSASDDDDGQAAAPFHPYALAFYDAIRVAGLVRVFGEAYPMSVTRGAAS